ncbi:MAG: VOC family protein [Nitrospira sp.]|nr:VOC family protein [Nitrospira sp.]
MPAQPGQPPMPDADRNLVMHVELPITGGHPLMGSDVSESMGHKCVAGNNVQINIEPDTRAEADRLFKALSAGGKVEMPMQDMFWGAYFGSFADKFGVKWTINCAAK